MRAGRTPILVRRFDDLSPEEDLAYFAQGLQEDLITELARFRALDVFAPAASGSEPPHGHELLGSVRRTPSGVAVHARLLEVASGRALWAERYDAQSRAPFEVQSAIAGSVARALAATLDQARLAVARRAPVTSLAAYDLWLRGRACLEQGSVEADMEARSLFQRALEIDPQFSRAYAGISLSYYNDWSCQSWHLWSESEQEARAHAERAVALDDGDAWVHIVLARVRLYRREFDRAEASIERALSLNPYETDVAVHAAIWLAFLGDTNRSLEIARRAIQSNPRHGDWYYAPLLWSHFLRGEWRDALRAGVRVGRSLVDLPAVTAAAAAMLGEADEARRALAAFWEEYRGKVVFGREPEPGEALEWILQVNPMRREEDTRRLRDGLIRAGLPQGSAPRAAELRPAELPAAGNVFRCEGNLWTLEFDGRGARLLGVKGFHDLSRLLASPRKPVHCLELAGAPAESGSAAVLDAEAKRTIRNRIEELSEELEEARSLGSAAREERAQEELERLTEALAGALGLGGRSRKLGDAGERARTAVTWRIRSAVRRIAAAHPRLGQHLENSIRTGLLCEYRPEQPIAWEV
ncbi:MAG: hypothetical protein JNJ88_15870 [Planctomycetes bacterium]|nr:hypothetical protein [Planctomycetota bacterium]